MPWKSEAQRKFMWARHPRLARKWHEKYGTPKDLPARKGKKKSKRSRAVEGLRRARP